MMIELALAAQIGSAAVTTPIHKVGTSFEAGTITYAPGESDPPGNHGYDVVLVPIDEGMTCELEGTPATWTPSVPILISRGAPHHLANATDHPIRFVEVRTIGDNPAGNDATVRSAGATIVRSVVGKYIRATVWRIERDGSVEWPADVEQIVIGTRSQSVMDAQHNAKTVPIRTFAATNRWNNSEGETEEVVRVSRLVVR